MSILYFEGPAGTGKTTSLMTALEHLLMNQPLTPDQRVLALTYMHGSRRRLEDRLRGSSRNTWKYLCTTFDSFAFTIACRWASLARFLQLSPPLDLDFNLTCDTAGSLLLRSEVRQWVARTYPIVVIDEMQDVSGGRLQMAKGLSVVTQMLAAADGFQNLNNDHDENEAVQWLRTDGETRNLHENYRTKNSALLTAATLLREGETLQRKGVKFIVLAAYTANVGASYAATNLTWHGCSDVVFLSPTGPDSAPFVNDLIGRLHRPITPGKLAKEVGPFRIGWEAGYQQMNLQTLDALGVSGGALSITGAELSGRASRCRFPELVDWVDKQRRLYGRIDFAVQVVRPEAERLLRIRHSYSASREGGLRAMTIHQAKNREFRGVVVLWPFQVQGTVLKQRRLLYNAITRAKEWCAIIVQGNNDRISKPPFHGDRG